MMSIWTGNVMFQIFLSQIPKKIIFLPGFEEILFQEGIVTVSPKKNRE